MTDHGTNDASLINPPNRQLAIRKMLIRTFDALIVTVILYFLTQGPAGSVLPSVAVFFALVLFMTFITWNRDYRKRPTFVDAGPERIILRFKGGASSSLAYEDLVGIVLTAFGGKLVIKRGRPVLVTQEIAEAVQNAYEKRTGRAPASIDRRRVRGPGGPVDK